MLRVYGTSTSPYVRRVLVIAHELGLDSELVDSSTDAGQAQLRALNPLWKLPTAELDGQPVFDSRVISRRLIEAHGGEGSLGLLARDDVASENLITVIDGVLDALITCFYFAREGVEPSAGSYLAKHQGRAAASMAWLDQAIAARSSASADFGLVEVALCTTVEWMRFRKTYPVDEHPAIVALAERHAARPSMVKTQPPG